MPSPGSLVSTGTAGAASVTVGWPTFLLSPCSYRLLDRTLPEITVLVDRSPARVDQAVTRRRDRRLSRGRDLRTQIPRVIRHPVLTTTIVQTARFKQSSAYEESSFTVAPDVPGTTDCYRLWEEVKDRA